MVTDVNLKLGSIKFAKQGTVLNSVQSKRQKISLHLKYCQPSSCKKCLYWEHKRPFQWKIEQRFIQKKLAKTRTLLMSDFFDNSREKALTPVMESDHFVRVTTANFLRLCVLTFSRAKPLKNAIKIPVTKMCRGRNYFIFYKSFKVSQIFRTFHRLLKNADSDFRNISFEFR